jgi:hypothetical protein
MLTTRRLVSVPAVGAVRPSVVSKARVEAPADERPTFLERAAIVVSVLVAFQVALLSLLGL